MPDLQRFRQSGVEPTTGVTSGLPGSVVATPRQVRPSVKALQILDTIDRTAPVVQQQLEKMTFEQGREDTLQAISGLPSLTTTEGQRKFAEMVQRGDRALGANPAVQQAVRRYGYQRMADLVMEDVRQRYYTSPYVGQAPDVVAQQAQGWIKERMDTLGLDPTDPGMIAFFNRDLEDKLQRQFLPVVGNDYIQQSGTQRREDMANAVGNLTESQLGVDFSSLSPEQSLAIHGDTAVGITQQVDALVSQGEQPLAAHRRAWDSFSGGIGRYAQQAYDAESMEQVDQIVDSALGMLERVPGMVPVDETNTWEDNTWVRDGQQQLEGKLERVRLQNKQRIQEEQDFTHKSRLSGGLMAINGANSPEEAKQALRAHTQSGAYTADELEDLQSYANTHITMLNKGLDKGRTGVGTSRILQLIANGRLDDPDTFKAIASQANQEEAELLWKHRRGVMDEYTNRTAERVQFFMRNLETRLTDPTTGTFFGQDNADAAAAAKGVLMRRLTPVLEQGGSFFDRGDANGMPTMSQAEITKAFDEYILDTYNMAMDATGRFMEAPEEGQVSPLQRPLRGFDPGTPFGAGQGEPEVQAQEARMAEGEVQGQGLDQEQLMRALLAPENQGRPVGDVVNEMRGEQQVEIERRGEAAGRILESRDLEDDFAGMFFGSEVGDDPAKQMTLRMYDNVLQDAFKVIPELQGIDPEPIILGMASRPFTQSYTTGFSAAGRQQIQPVFDALNALGVDTTEITQRRASQDSLFSQAYRRLAEELRKRL